MRNHSITHHFNWFFYSLNLNDFFWNFHDLNICLSNNFSCHFFHFNSLTCLIINVNNFLNFNWSLSLLNNWYFYSRRNLDYSFNLYYSINTNFNNYRNLNNFFNNSRYNNNFFCNFLNFNNFRNFNHLFNYFIDTNSNFFYSLNCFSNWYNFINFHLNRNFFVNIMNNWFFNFNNFCPFNWETNLTDYFIWPFNLNFLNNNIINLLWNNLNFFYNHRNLNYLINILCLYLFNINWFLFYLFNVDRFLYFNDFLNNNLDLLYLSNSCSNFNNFLNHFCCWY